MQDLDDLLTAAAKAGREDRISWRDPIAECGSLAVPAMRGWLTDPELGAFAVRVLERIAAQAGDRPLVVEALSSVTPEDVSAAVARDLADARGRVTGQDRARLKGPSGPAATQWAGYASATPIERRFHDDMLDIFRLAGEATRKQRSDGTVVRGYWASYFLRGVRNHGGLAYAHQLLLAEGTTDGFARLQQEGRLDLTLEALVLRLEYASLFSEYERQTASSRLARAGFQPSGRS